MSSPKTLEQMAEEYARLEYKRWLDSPALDGGTAMHNQIARFYIAGAQAALRLPEVLAMREALSGCHSCWEASVEPHPVETAKLNFDRLAGEVGE